jgi:hypothetical protein
LETSIHFVGLLPKSTRFPHIVAGDTPLIIGRTIGSQTQFLTIPGAAQRHGCHQYENRLTPSDSTLHNDCLVSRSREPSSVFLNEVLDHSLGA